MCRLCATTFRNVQASPDLKRLIVHEAMLRTDHEDLGQRDGWGVTDGEHIWKSAAAYNDDVPFWLPKANDTGFLMSHIRKASTNTGRALIDSHPYEFTVNGGKMIAAHNGWIEGTGWSKWEKDRPQTDSWRALTKLTEIMTEKDSKVIDAALVEEWISNYQTGSHYVFMILWNGMLNVIRGNSRPMHLFSIGDGWMLNTSGQGLDIMKSYIEGLYEIECGKVLRMNDHTIMRFALGEPKYEYESFEPKYATRAYNNSYGYQGGTTYPKSNAATPTTTTPASSSTSDKGTTNQTTSLAVVVNGEGSGDESDTIIAPAVTAPRIRRGGAAAVMQHVLEGMVEGSASAVVAEKATWTKMVGKLSPLRASLSRFWVSNLLGYELNITIPEHKFLALCTEKDLELADAALFLRDASGTTYRRPFNQVSYLMINWWNRAVKPQYDVEAHIELFGREFFWLNSAYTQNPRFVQTKNAHIVVADWTQDVVELILQNVQTEQMEKYFDITYVTKELLA